MHTATPHMYGRMGFNLNVPWERVITAVQTAVIDPWHSLGTHTDVGCRWQRM